MTHLVHTSDDLHAQATAKVLGKKVRTLAFGAYSRVGGQVCSSGAWSLRNLGRAGHEGFGKNAVDVASSFESRVGYDTWRVSTCVSYSARLWPPRTHYTATTASVHDRNVSFCKCLAETGSCEGVHGSISGR